MDDVEKFERVPQLRVNLLQLLGFSGLVKHGCKNNNFSVCCTIPKNRKVTSMLLAKRFVPAKNRRWHFDFLIISEKSCIVLKDQIGDPLIFPLPLETFKKN